MIRAVFMDIDNTLLDFDAAAQEGMAHCFEDAGLIYKPEMFSVFKEENDRIWKKIEQGILTMDDLPYVRWQAILKKLGLEADGVAMEMLFRKCLFYSAVPMEGAKEILDHLQGKYILCTASNGPYEQQICRLKKADRLWGKNPAPCHIAMAGFRELPSEPDLHLSAYPALQMSV